MSLYSKDKESVAFRWYVNGTDHYPCSSCKEILDLDCDAPSGEYPIKTSAANTLKSVRTFVVHTL